MPVDEDVQEMKGELGKIGKIRAGERRAPFVAMGLPKMNLAEKIASALDTAHLERKDYLGELEDAKKESQMFDQQTPDLEQLFPKIEFPKLNQSSGLLNQISIVKKFYSSERGIQKLSFDNKQFNDISDQLKIKALDQNKRANERTQQNYMDQRHDRFEADHRGGNEDTRNKASQKLITSHLQNADRTKKFSEVISEDNSISNDTPIEDKLNRNKVRTLSKEYVGTLTIN